MDCKFILKFSALAGLCMQMGHPPQTASAPEGSLIVTDKFCNFPSLGTKLRALTDEEVAMMGTIGLDHMDPHNRNFVMVTIANLYKEVWGYWGLCQAYLRQGKPQQATIEIIHNAGSIMWKNWTIVTFFSSDLAATTTVPIMVPDKMLFAT